MHGYALAQQQTASDYFLQIEKGSLLRERRIMNWKQHRCDANVDKLSTTTNG